MSVPVVDVGTMWVNAHRLARIIRDNGVDLVHMNNGFTPSEGIIAASRAGVPVLVHHRGFSKGPFTELQTSYMSRAACVITVSDAAGAALRDALPDVTVLTVYDPVDIERSRAALSERDAARRELGVADDQVLAGIFGRIVRWKGQAEFVEALVGVMRDRPELVGVIVGDVSDGSERYMEEIEARVQASPYPDRFIFTGYRDDVENLYAAIDIAVHASISPEPFGMVIPEAMAAGKPVIATDAGGPREIVTHEVDGLLVPMGDVRALGEAVATLAGDPALRREMGAKGAATVAERFTIEQNAGAIRRVYDEILGGAGETVRDGEEASPG